MKTTPGPARCVYWLDRALATATSLAAFLALPLALLLCAQWPLRDFVRAYSREANDLAQLVFGVYVAVAITYATRMHSHLTPDLFARRYPKRVRAWLSRWTTIGIVMPWTLFILYASTPMVVQSFRQLEGFPDTFNPGYFLLKGATWLMALLIFLQALVDIFRPTLPSHSGEAA